ncbi:hypothetical protein W59_01174 [Rhodococcus opacus RKJ300 = JCM 13270]|uniref:Uncharacterized protein n=1 Tax=Rhodococcus opacus RKJ300 = JCM 13270 TaxID=1165867 RepID=I0WZC3_RHOOP|nr:hypothetical protein W59_01174 [Rhodococcus opacus RKJ300 = JCM 13270]
MLWKIAEHVKAALTCMPGFVVTRDQVDAVEESCGGVLAVGPSFVRIDHCAFLSLNWADDMSR